MTGMEHQPGPIEPAAVAAAFDRKKIEKKCPVCHEFRPLLELSPRQHPEPHRILKITCESCGNIRQFDNDYLMVQIPK